jgi:hypothetical protein
VAKTKTTMADFPDCDPQVFYELARDRLSTQLSIIDALDDKIGLLAGLASGLLGILAAVFALSAEASAAQLVVLVGATVAYGYVATESLRAYRERDWHVGPDLRQVWDEMHDGEKVSDALWKWRMANDTWASYKHNHVSEKAKADALPGIFVGVVIQSGLVVLALVLVATEV